MSEFLKNLNEALANKIYIEPPLFVESRLGSYYQHPTRGIITELKQFAVTPDGVFEGPGIKHEYHKIPKTEFVIEHIQQLVEMILNHSKKIAFCQLVMPIVEKCYTERHKNVLGRYIECYIPMTDEIGKRWDFLIQKLD